MKNKAMLLLLLLISTLSITTFRKTDVGDTPDGKDLTCLSIIL